MTACDKHKYAMPYTGCNICLIEENTRLRKQRNKLRKRLKKIERAHKGSTEKTEDVFTDARDASLEAHKPDIDPRNVIDVSWWRLVALNIPNGAYDSVFTWPDGVYLRYLSSAYGGTLLHIVNVKDEQKDIQITGSGADRIAAEHDARRKYIAALFEANHR